MKNFSLKYRIYPTPQQEEYLSRNLGCARKVYNMALNQYRQSKKSHPNVKWDTYFLVKQLVIWKKDPDYSYLNEVSSIVLQQSILNLGKSFHCFFEGISKEPKFKKKGFNECMRLTKNRFKVKNSLLYITKQKTGIKIALSRPLPEGLEAKSISIRRTSANKWFVSFCYQEDSLTPLPQSDKVIGVDLGLEHFLTTSNGDKVNNPRFFRKYAKELAREQRKLSRKRKGSNNYHKQRVKVARVHEKIVNCRLDFLHKLSTKLINENQVICLEDLCIKDMIAQGSRGLRKSIFDASWSEFVRQLEYKAEWYGRQIFKVDRYFPSSQICNSCGVKTPSKLNLRQRTWTCSSCETFHDRDVNAAKNILTAGLAGRACGFKSCA